MMFTSELIIVSNSVCWINSGLLNHKYSTRTRGKKTMHEAKGHTDIKSRSTKFEWRTQEWTRALWDVHTILWQDWDNFLSWDGDCQSLTCWYSTENPLPKQTKLYLTSSSSHLCTFQIIFQLAVSGIQPIFILFSFFVLTAFAGTDSCFGVSNLQKVLANKWIQICYLKSTTG